jgi:outer membrane protein assembly factor BamB
LNIPQMVWRQRLWLLVGLVLLGTACVPFRQEASWPALRVIDDKIAVAFNREVVLVNVQDGLPVRLRNADGEVRLDEEGNARVWQFSGGTDDAANQFYSAPVVLGDETLLIAAYNKRLYAVNMSSARASTTAGVELPGQVVANPVVNEGLVYIGIGEGSLVALSAEDFSQQWQINTDQGVWSEPLIHEGVLYFTSLDHFLYAVDAQTGAETWKLDLQGAAPVSPIVYNDRLYVGSFARKIFEISLAGEILNEFKTDDWVWSAPTIVDDVLYAADLAGVVYAVDVADGGFALLWRSDVSERAVRTAPVVYDEYVIVGGRDQKVYWLSRTDGSIFWSRDVATEVLSDLLLIEPSETVNIPKPYVVVATLASEEPLVAFTVDNGERIWPNN